jgi:hypothetical protein
MPPERNATLWIRGEQNELLMFHPLLEANIMGTCAL